MKFVYQKFDIKEIERRVREEECRTGKRVVEVILNGREWRDFVIDMDLLRNSCAPPAAFYRFHLRRPMPPLSCITGPCSCDAVPVDIITVRPE